MALTPAGSCLYSPSASTTGLSPASSCNLPSGPLTYLATVLADSPAGYWKLDEPSGVTAADSSGHGLDGTYTAGPTLNVSPLINAGKAATFDGSSQYVLLPSSALLNPTAAITLECWLKIASSASNSRMMSSQTGSGGGDKFLLRRNTPHKAEVTLWDSGDNGQTYAGSVTIDDNLRHYVAATYDGATIKLYVDGVADGAGFAVVMTLESVLHTAQIACRLNSVGAFSEGFGGTLDEVAIYPTALSPARIAAHYAAGIAV